MHNIMDSKDPQKSILALNNLVGYGDYNSKYWFMGIEEGQTWKFSTSEKNRIEFFIKIYEISRGPFAITNECMDKAINSEISNSPLYRAVVRLFNCLEEKEINQTDIGSTNIDLFISNMYPLAMSDIKTDYDENYYKYFGIKSRNDYLISELFAERKKILKDKINEHVVNKKKPLFIFGKNIWQEFKNIFNELEFDDISNKSNSPIIRYGEKSKGYNIFLLYYPYPKWLNNDDLLRLSNYIKSK